MCSQVGAAEVRLLADLEPLSQLQSFKVRSTVCYVGLDARLPPSLTELWLDSAIIDPAGPPFTSARAESLRRLLIRDARLLAGFSNPSTQLPMLQVGAALHQVWYVGCLAFQRTSPIHSCSGRFRKYPRGRIGCALWHCFTCAAQTNW